ARAPLDRDEVVPHPQASPPVRRLPRSGERARWNALVTRALGEIRSGTLEKVVIARAIDVEANAPLDPRSVLRALEARYPTCRGFLARGAGAVFLGATPELLCRVEGKEVQADALAGTAPPGEADSLPGSQKELREHRSVVDHIASALLGISEHVHRPPEPTV